METTITNKRNEELDDLQRLYILSGHWKSDMEFYREDLKFLYHLIDNYVIWITKKEHLQMVEKIKKEMHALKMKDVEMIVHIGEHQTRLAGIIDNFDARQIYDIRLGHAELENQISAFLKSFREHKRKVFEISGYIIDSEQMGNIIKR